MNAQPESEHNPFASPFEEVPTTDPSPAVEAAERLKQAAGSNIRKLREAAEAGIRTFRDASVETAEPAGQNWEELRNKLKDLHQEGEVWARENPTAAMLAAAGAGFVLGLLLKR